MHVGERIAKRMQELGMSDEFLAKECNCSVEVVRRLKERAAIDQKNADGLSFILECPADYLLGKVDSFDAPDPEDHVGIRLKRLRQEKNLSATEFANEINVHRGMVATMERTDRIFEDRIDEIAKVLDCSKEYIMGETNDRYYGMGRAAEETAPSAVDEQEEAGYEAPVEDLPFAEDFSSGPAKEAEPEAAEEPSVMPKEAEETVEESMEESEPDFLEEDAPVFETEDAMSPDQEADTDELPEEEALGAVGEEAEAGAGAELPVAEEPALEEALPISDAEAEEAPEADIAEEAAPAAGPEELDLSPAINPPVEKAEAEGEEEDAAQVEEGDDRTLGQRISAIRTEKGITASDLGEAIGRSGSYVRTVEDGKNDPYVVDIARIAAFLGTNASFLVTGRNSAAEEGAQLTMGQFLKNARENCGTKYTYADLGRIAGVSGSTIKKAEDTSNTTVSILLALCVTYGVSASEALALVNPEAVPAPETKSTTNEGEKKAMKEQPKAKAKTISNKSIPAIFQNEEGKALPVSERLEIVMGTLRDMAVSPEDQDLIEKYHNLPDNLRIAVNSIMGITE